jgi:uncharacterized lipoprotein YehR (DUF1307 family)
MKKSMKILAALMVVVMLALTLAACGKTLSGDYSADGGILGETTYSFKGKKVEISYKSILGTVTTIDAEYEIEDDKITITLPEDEKDEDAKKLGGTFAFEETDDGIKIDGLEFIKK